VRKRQEMQEVLRQMINVVGSLICCQHRMSDSAREGGALFVIAVPGLEYLAKLTLGHTGPF
jgi:hypothetical protein